MARRRLRHVTHDHSLVQELVDAGAMRPEQALSHPRANVITRAVGADCATLELDKKTDRLRAGDRFLLCSDGLSKSVPERDIARLLGAAAEASPADRLIEEALGRNVDDNVTAVTIEVLANPSGGGLEVADRTMPNVASLAPVSTNRA